MSDATAAGGRLAGKAVLITGGARGQGAAEARLAAAEGADVVVTDVVDDAGRAVAAEVGGTYHHLDVASLAAWRAVIDDVVAERGRLDGLVNNAALFREGGLFEVDEATLRTLTDVNQLGVAYGMVAVAPVMRSQGSGSIVNISSISGTRGHGSIAYVGTKWAVRGMTKSAAYELGAFGVRVNAVLPGAIDTEMLTSRGEDRVSRLTDLVPLQRAKRPEEVATAVVFLLSDESSYVNGAELLVDGGVTAR